MILIEGAAEMKVILGFILSLPLLSYIWRRIPNQLDQTFECVNPVILATKPFHDQDLPPDFEIKFVTVHQRHLDRWIYQHDFINNVCWPNQQNSTDLKNACDYELSSVWEDFTRTQDPYAKPEFGNCNAKQLTTSGIAHSQTLGSMIKNQFPTLVKSCSKDNILLECDEAQKNQQTTQNVYKGICGKLPDKNVFMTNSVVDHGDIAKGKPWFLSTGRCGNSKYDAMMAKATTAMANSDLADKMEPIVTQVAAAASKPMPARKDYATLLDNLEDCWVCHECLGLNDVPKEFL
eukprot:UN01369